MAIEIEKKFLVKSDAWREEAVGMRCTQGYLPTQPDSYVTARIRVIGTEAWVTIKGPTEGAGRSEYEYPDLADRSTPGEWEAAGSPDIRQLAGERVKSILSTHYPEYIDPAIDAKIRDTFPILLPQEVMQAGNGRW